jgi:hypothetical protein
MAVSEQRADCDLEALRLLSEGLIRNAGRSAVRGNLLEIHHPGAPLLDPELLHAAAETYGISIRLSQDQQGRAGQSIRCVSSRLPFQDRVFSLVVLHHVIGDGGEAELPEAVRVLARNGVLILVGLSRLGWRYRAQSEAWRLPGIAPLRVKSRLEQLGMTMQGFAGAGLAGMRRPTCMSSGLAGLAVPLADLVLLQARHCDHPEVTTLRFRKSRPAVVQSAPMRG